MLILSSYLQQEIAEASDEAAKKCYNKTPNNKRSGLGVTTAMRATTKSKH